MKVGFENWDGRYSSFSDMFSGFVLGIIKCWFILHDLCKFDFVSMLKKPAVGFSRFLYCFAVSSLAMNLIAAFVCSPVPGELLRSALL